jgi:hypothetical protein
VRPTSTAGGIRKAQARAIRSREAGWDANYKRYLKSFKADAEKTIKMWNDRMAGGDKEPLWVPLLICAVAARMTWMHVHCPGCNTIAAVDLTMVRRPPTTALTSIAEKLKCERCRGQAAPPRIGKISNSHEG